MFLHLSRLPKWQKTSHSMLKAISNHFVIEFPSGVFHSLELVSEYSRCVEPVNSLMHVRFLVYRLKAKKQQLYQVVLFQSIYFRNFRNDGNVKWFFHLFLPEIFSTEYNQNQQERCMKIPSLKFKNQKKVKKSGGGITLAPYVPEAEKG